MILRPRPTPRASRRDLPLAALHLLLVVHLAALLQVALLQAALLQAALLQVTLPPVVLLQADAPSADRETRHRGCRLQTRLGSRPLVNSSP